MRMAEVQGLTLLGEGGSFNAALVGWGRDWVRGGGGRRLGRGPCPAVSSAVQCLIFYAVTCVHTKLSFLWCLCQVLCSGRVAMLLSQVQLLMPSHFA